MRPPVSQTAEGFRGEAAGTRGHKASGPLAGQAPLIDRSNEQKLQPGRGGSPTRHRPGRSMLASRRASPRAAAQLLRTLASGAMQRLTDRPVLTATAGALTIAFSAILVRLSHATPSTAAV